jgi:hypothetical protein
VGARLVGGAIELPRERPVEDVVDQRGLPRPAHAGDGRQHAERELDVDVLQVVGARALDEDVAAVGGAPGAGCLNRALAAQVRAGQRAVAVPEQLGGRPLEDHLPAVLAGPGAEVHDVVGGADRLLVVFDDEDGVAEIAEAGERGEQRAVVALVQPDRRLVEDVEHAGQVGADLRRQPDALPLPPESVAALRPSVR